MSLHEVELLIREYGIRPNKLLGQNFMIDSSLYPLLADYVSLRNTDVVLEVGAGFGFLTRFLCDRCKFVIAVEKDRVLISVLKRRLNLFKNVSVLEGDLLKVPVPGFDKVISIPPYQISSRLLIWLFDRSFESAAFIFQEEFVQRVTAKVGSDEYSWLTVLTDHYASIRVLDSVPHTMFFPQPTVDSVIIQLKKKLNPLPGIRNPLVFRRMLRFLFSDRNKKVSNAAIPFLRSILHFSSEEAKKSALSIPFRDERVRTITPENFGEIAVALKI